MLKGVRLQDQEFPHQRFYCFHCDSLCMCAPPGEAGSNQLLQKNSVECNLQLVFILSFLSEAGEEFPEVNQCLKCILTVACLLSSH